MARRTNEHPTARAIRTARTYAGMSRAGLGAAIGKSGETIGNWERGQWESDGPPDLFLEAIIRVTNVPTSFADDVFLLHEDPAKRFAAAARQEAERTGERPESEPEAPHGEDEEDVGP